MRKLEDRFTIGAVGINSAGEFQRQREEDDRGDEENISIDGGVSYETVRLMAAV